MRLKVWTMRLKVWTMRLKVVSMIFVTKFNSKPTVQIVSSVNSLSEVLPVHRYIRNVYIISTAFQYSKSRNFG